MRALGNVEDSLKNQLVTNFESADISDLDKAILNYAAKLTREPASISETDVSDFRAKHAELTDHMLHDIVQVVSYFNYVNRLADGLGVELEERFKK
ncbi:MAG: peroxidase [candidate division Zixibacteria bacterium]|nr:peroxidase [candidate division Zixibacteria bacterium]